MSAPLLSIRVYGHPAPQGSKRALRNAASGRIQLVESSKAVKPWRADVKQAALDAGAADQPPYDGPVQAVMAFTFARPKSHYLPANKSRPEPVLRPDAPPHPHGKPDLSKLLRSTEDALTGLVWTDDSRIVAYVYAGKVWAGEDLMSLDRPGALIRIFPADSPYAPKGPRA